ncbi:MAG: glyoxalase [Comamonadaceae bacterium]|nr:MAG: glyoxalase [Comamonadaceae bacterium]
MTAADDIRTTTVSCMRYRDAPAAIDWLCRIFGFERHLVVEGEAGRIAHAQLTRGSGMIMLGSSTNGSAYGELMRLPGEVGGFSTQSVYLVVPDPDAVYARANAGGARIVIDIKDEDHGGRGFTCCDLEGHVWSIGSYDPWKV